MRSFRKSVSTQPRPISDIGSEQETRPKLVQARAAEPFQIVLPVGFLLDRHLVCDPGERNIGLRAAKLLQRGCGDIVLAGHAGGGGEHSVGADEIAALTDALARQPHRLVVIASDELGVGGDAVVDRRKRIARAQPQRAARGRVAFLPAPAIGQRQAVIALGQREIWIEAQRQLELGQRVVEAPREQIDAAQRVVRPGVLAVGPDRRQRRALGDRQRSLPCPPNPCGR